MLESEVLSMKTEIIREKLHEYFYPSVNWVRCTDKVLVDYAEIEIDPKGIKKLEDNLDRCQGQKNWSDEEWAEINDSSDDAYEHIIAYVHFNADTENFNKLFLYVRTVHDSVELMVKELLNEEEMNIIIDYARELICNGRASGKVIDCGV